MNPQLLVAVPLLLAVVLALLAFAGCDGFTGTATEKTGTTTAPPGSPPPPVTTPPVDTRPSYTQAIAAVPGIAAHWPISETDGALTIVDDQANHLVGTCTKTNASVLRPGAVGGRDAADGAMRLTSPGRVTVPYSAVLNPVAAVSFTVELWVKFPVYADRVAGKDAALVSSVERIGGTPAGYELAVSFAKPSAAAGGRKVPTFTASLFGGGAGGTSASVTTATAAMDDEWHHVTLVYDAAALTLTLTVRNPADRAAVNTSTEPSAVYAPNSAWDLVLGAAHDTETTYKRSYTGWLDELAFYHRALSAAEIEANFTNALPLP